MTRYLLTIYQPDGPPPPPDQVDLDRVMQDVGALIREAKEAGAWVFNGGLAPPSTSTVVRFSEGELYLTDGPYAEGKEHVGGLMVIDAPDLDAALEWGRKAARAITNLAIEVRPFQDEPES
jgi:hypothetical protein